MPTTYSWSELPSDYSLDNLAEYKDLFILGREFTEDPTERDTLYWSLRLMMETNGGMKYRDSILGYKNTAYGYFDQKKGRESFGVIVYADHRVRWINKLLSFFTFLFRRKGTPSKITVDGHTFPIVKRHIKEIRHTTQVNPPDGTSTCIAISREEKNQQAGILTASHVVDYSYQKNIALSCGCKGKVTQLGHCIEAAVISSECPIINNSNTTKLFPQKMVSAKTKVAFTGSNNIHVKTSIRQVTDTRGLYLASIIPIIIYLKDAGYPGDSGALVEGRLPLGIYIGKYEVKETGETGGLAQHLYQVAEIMKLDLYQ